MLSQQKNVADFFKYLNLKVFCIIQTWETHSGLAQKLPINKKIHNFYSMIVKLGQNNLPMSRKNYLTVSLGQSRMGFPCL